MERAKDLLFGDHSSKLNFDADEFYSEDFSVDEFILRKRETVPLDVLRDDLGYHLKSLRSSLIELINKDYGQFVNLSSNLVGLDGKIQNIVGPLQRAQTDLQEFDAVLQEHIKNLDSELRQRIIIRKTKEQLKYYQLAAKSLQTAKNLLTTIPAHISTRMEFNILKNTCEEVAETRFHLQCCMSCQLKDHIEAEFKSVCDSCLYKLNDVFKTYADSSSSDQIDSDFMIETLLYIYTELQSCNTVENFLVQQLLLPMLESSLQTKGNIGALFECTDNFVNNSPVLRVSQNTSERPWLLQYDFIGRSIFPCVTSVLTKHFPHVFSPSNPNVFHNNWSKFETFLRMLEGLMPSFEHVERFRNSPMVKEILDKWQFPIYFQLRFHSIATELEESLEDIYVASCTEDFKFESTRIMIKSVLQCWDKEKTYISRIAGRFLKASSMLVSRYLKKVETELSSTNHPLINYVNFYSDLNVAELLVGQLLAEKFDTEFNSSSEAVQYLSEFKWELVKNSIAENLVENVVKSCSDHLVAVNEIPRLYRRTNREAPTKHLEYVESLIAPMESARNDMVNAHQLQLWNDVGKTIGTVVIKKYKSQLNEVLISVQRMEESLRRLKKVKGHVSETKGLSDDDKIRMQLKLDVQYFSNKVKFLHDDMDVSSIEELFHSTGKV